MGPVRDSVAACHGTVTVMVPSHGHGPRGVARGRLRIGLGVTQARRPAAGKP